MPTGVSSKRSLRPERFSVLTSFPRMDTPGASGLVSASFASELLRTYAQRRIDRGRDWPARILRRQGLNTDQLAWVTGAALGISRQIWQDLGGFDRTFFLFF